jgi:hypothetical protein
MSLLFVPPSQQSTISAGTAVTWRFDRAAVIVVQRGRVWVTLDGGSNDAAAPRGGDWFIDAGTTLRIAPRQRLVLEPAGVAGEPVTVGVYAEAVFLARPLAWLARLGKRAQAAVLGTAAAIRA